MGDGFFKGVTGFFKGVTDRPKASLCQCRLATSAICANAVRSDHDRIFSLDHSNTPGGSTGSEHQDAQSARRSEICRSATEIVRQELSEAYHFDRFGEKSGNASHRRFLAQFGHLVGGHHDDRNTIVAPH